LIGGHDSLIYFREIAKRTETAFIEQFQQQSDEAYVKDMLAQVCDDISKEIRAIFTERWSLRDGEKVPEDSDLKLTNDGVELDPRSRKSIQGQRQDRHP
jgi:hypothetical protein